VTGLKPVGTITRSHGLQGALKANIHIAGFPDLDKGEPVFILLQGGPVPFFVEEIDKQGKGQLILKLEDVNSLQQTERLIGCELLMERGKFDVPDQDASNELIGYKVVDDEKGDIGTVSGIMDNPQHPILEIELKGKTILVPWVEEIINEVDMNTRVVKISAPDGLIDLYING
jgi:16S rRNA processing protein RimM